MFAFAAVSASFNPAESSFSAAPKLPGRDLEAVGRAPFDALREGAQRRSPPVRTSARIAATCAVISSSRRVKRSVSRPHSERGGWL